MDRDPSNGDLPTSTKSGVSCTRMLDNHYDPSVHEKPWKANGALPTYKYDYGDSGLGFMMHKQHKLRNFTERHEYAQAVDQMNKRLKGYRHFPEYEDIGNNEIMITIEFCTNCKLHQSSTRHDEEKYATFANVLKREIVNQYPIIKVLLKPLIFDHEEESVEAVYLRSRLGAFEVQLYRKNGKGEIIRELIFSKLRSKVWPSIARTVEEIANYLPTDDLTIRLIHPTNEHSENKLKGLHIVLRPIKTYKKNSPTKIDFGSKNNESSRHPTQGTSRPTSAYNRPKSAYSTTTTKSMSGKKGQREETMETTTPPKEYVEMSDGSGVVVFKQIPFNIYEVELLETQNYLPEKKVINMFDMVENGEPFEIEVILKEQTMGFCRVKIVENGVPFSNASIIVAKVQTEKSKTAVLREKEAGSGVFEFMIDPGHYSLKINKMGYMEKTLEILAKKGANEWGIDMNGNQTPQSELPKQEPQVVVKPEDRPSSRQRPESSKGRPESSKGRPESSKGRHDQTSASKINSKGNLDVIPQENMEGSPSKKTATHAPIKEEKREELTPDDDKGVKKERVKSALVKKVDFIVLNVDTEVPIAGATITLEEIGFKGVTNEEGRCVVPVNKLINGKLILNHDEFFGMVEEYGGEDGTDMKSSPEKKFLLIPRPHDIHEVHFRFLPGNGVPCAKFSVLYNRDAEETKTDITVQHREGGKEVIVLKNLLKRNGVFRIVAEIFDINEFFHPESTVIFSHYEDCEPFYNFPPPEEMLTGPKLYWDVGFFADPVSNPQFVEINGYSTTEIGMYSHLKEYQLLLSYLHNSKSDLKTLLGFNDKSNKRRVERDGDIFIPKETIYASLDKYGLEIKNVDHLLLSARNPEGLYGFRECERRFGSLKPPFNFVKDQTSDAGEEYDVSGSEGEEEEYLFEDEH